jgi:chromosome segregation ATPase
MSLFRRKPERPLAEEREAEVAALRERVARLEADLALLRKKNAELAREASPALKENAVLRYELFKCQTDRQVLELHLSGLRAELRGTLALLRRLAPGESLLKESLPSRPFWSSWRWGAGWGCRWRPSGRRRRRPFPPWGVP